MPIREAYRVGESGIEDVVKIDGQQVEEAFAAGLSKEAVSCV
jgi:hypothetical protein